MHTVLRDGVIEQVLKSPSTALNAEVFDVAAQVQTAFFDALEAFDSQAVRADIPGVHRRLAYVYRIPVRGHELHLLCFNSAWLSVRDERQGRLVVPPEVVPASAGAGTVMVAVFHHPYNWMEANVARRFRRAIEDVADLILTGHEHQAEMRVQESASGDHFQFFEGGVLQESADPNASEFNVIVLDLSAGKQKSTRVVWNGHAYLPVRRELHEGDPFGLTWEDFPGRRLKQRGMFRLTAEFDRHLDELGVDLERSDGSPVRLPDVFVMPDLQEIALFQRKLGRIVRSREVSSLVADNPFIFIVGDQQSGKTSLAKVLTRQFLQGGFVPLLVNDSLRFPSTDHLYRHLSDIAEVQFGKDVVDKFNQLDRSMKAIIVDDLHLQRLGPKKKAEYFRDLAKYAGRVVVLSDESLLDTLDDVSLRRHNEDEFEFKQFKILPLGNVRREDLIER